MKRIVTFRFDVDTELCLREGVPRLLDLAERVGVRFTFFVNPGRAIRRLDLFRPHWAQSSGVAAKLPALRKLGVLELAYLVAANPSALPRHASALHHASLGGHDLGLHGGRNHAAWAREARQWSPERLAEEVGFGLSRFREAGLDRPTMFASPGWNSPEVLPKILASRGFRVLADDHGLGKRRGVPGDPLARIPTAICGEPGGVGYLEHVRAHGYDDVTVRRDFRGRLEAEGTYACVYDHPFYAGRHDLERLEMLIEVAMGDGWEVAPMTSHPSVGGLLSNR
jgi:peptidoglycan/xylan/chitin deacetylase (PgdA/CDA1 family)